MADRFYFTIPSDRELKRESGWKRTDPPKNSFYAVRCHYVIRERQLDEPVRHGEVIDAYSSAQGLGQKKTQTVEAEHAAIQLAETVRGSLAEEETLAKFASSLSAGIGSDALGKISSEISAEAQAKLSQSFSQNFKVQTSNTLTQKSTLTWEYTVDPEKFPAEAMVVLTKAYKKYAYDIYLALVDYLRVEYTQPSLVARPRRVKTPLLAGDKWPNIIRCNLPLASIHAWKLLPKTALPIVEKDYQLEVEDPLEMTVQPLIDDHPFRAKVSIDPSLYKLANSAFPLKR